MTLALVIPYNNTELMDETQRAAQKSGYALILEFTPEPGVGAEDRALDIALSRQVDGLIWMPTPTRRLVSKRDLPNVVSTRLSTTATISFSGDLPSELNRVYVDYRAGLHEAINHLALGGYREILYVTCAYERFGFHFGAEIERICIARGLKFLNFDAASDADLPRELDKRLKARSSPLGVIGTDFACFEVVSSCKRLGKDIPREIGIVAYGDLLVGGRYRLGEFTSSSLTAIRVPYGALGQTAVNTLIKQIEAPDTKPTSVCLKPELIQRHSTIEVKAE